MCQYDDIVDDMINATKPPGGSLVCRRDYVTGTPQGLFVSFSLFLCAVDFTLEKLQTLSWTMVCLLNCSFRAHELHLLLGLRIFAIKI